MKNYFKFVNSHQNYLWLSLVFQVSQLCNPMDMPTIILYSYKFKFEKHLGPSPHCCSEWEAASQRGEATGHLPAPLQLTGGKFLCKSDIKRWRLNSHRIVSFAMSGFRVPRALFWNGNKIQGFHLTSDLTIFHISPCVESGGHSRELILTVPLDI